MTRIGIISDTHSVLLDKVFEHFKNCDEIWHAGDIGNAEVLEKLEKFKPTRAVYGNIDGKDVRIRTTKHLFFNCEGHKIYMTHIGGYPGRYNRDAYPNILKHRPDLFICGHSHILKIIKDHKFNLLHINPGAFGNHGFHKINTLVRFDLAPKSISNMEVVEVKRQTTSTI